MISVHMAHALELARSVKGRTSPNPAVGAVLVREGRIVGEGATQPYGQAHAEPVALRQAGDRARGSTLYVTLEPCSHYGRTAPCTEAIVDAGVTEVHLATWDPNPAVVGRGHARLVAAGIRTHVGEAAAEARALNEDFARWITTGRPYVIAKMATSLDGRLATRTGDARWITGAEARAVAHRLRDHMDAILVGVQTVLADDPQLTTRLNEKEPGQRPPKHPWRLVADSHARTPPTARLLDHALPGRTTIFTTGQAPAERRAALERAGAEVCVLPSLNGRVQLTALLDELGRRNVSSLLVEGGATIHGAFFDEDLVDRVHAFIAPLVIGGAAAPGAVGGTGSAKLVDARRLLEPEYQQCGVDTLISGYVRRVQWPSAASGSEQPAAGDAGD